jgi:hypothetical protein
MLSSCVIRCDRASCIGIVSHLLWSCIVCQSCVIDVIHHRCVLYRHRVLSIVAVRCPLLFVRHRHCASSAIVACYSPWSCTVCRGCEPSAVAVHRPPLLCVMCRGHALSAVIMRCVLSIVVVHRLLSLCVMRHCCVASAIVLVS